MIGTTISDDLPDCLSSDKGEARYFDDETPATRFFVLLDREYLLA